MTLRNLEIFVKTCETGNMTLAAQQLYISQSAVSHAISQLEDYFDVKLFVRQSNRIYPTVAGGRLLAQSRQLLLQQSRLESSMKLERVHRSIRIGVVNTFGQQLILELMADYLEKHSDVDFSVQSYPAAVIPEMLDISAIDIAFTFENEDTKYTSSFLVRHREKGFACCTGSRFIEAKTGEAIPLTRFPKGELPFFIEADSEELIPKMAEIFGEQGVQLKVCGVLQTPDEVKQAASLDLGIGMLSKPSCFITPQMTFFDIEGFAFSIDLYLMYNRSQVDNHHISDFIEFVRQSIDKLLYPKLMAYSVYEFDDTGRPKHAFYN